MKTSILVTLCLILINSGSVSAQGDGLTGRYYWSSTLTDTVITFDETQFAFERIDPMIDFWAPTPNLYYRWEPVSSSGDNYGVAWTGWIHIETQGEYAFGTISDDGSQVWINGQLVVDNYEDQWWDWEDSLVEGSTTGLYPAEDGGREETFPGPIMLDEGYHEIEVRFRETGAYDGIELWWLLPGSGPSDIPYYGDSFHGMGITANAATNWQKVPQDVLFSANPNSAATPTVALGRLDAAPNPFNPTITVTFAPSRPGPVRLSVYDIIGRRIDTLFRGDAGDMPLTIVWQGRDASGRAVSSGTYFLRLENSDETISRKVTLVR